MSLRILYVINELQEGGAENALCEIARRVHHRGHAVRVLALYGADGAPAQRLRSDGVEVAEVGVTRLVHAERMVRELRRAVREFKPELVHAWLFHANLACRVALPRSLPLVCSLRVCEPRKLHVLLDRWTRGRVSLYFANSTDVAEFARHRLKVAPERVCTVRNGVDAAAFARARRHRASDTRLNGLTVARITRQKGVDILLRGLALLPAELPWQWTFAGDMPDPAYARRMKALAETLGVADRILWRGRVPRQDVPALYREATVFGLPSRWEGEPNAVLEAMAAELPALAAPVQGVQGLLTEQPDCLVPVPDNTPADWAEVLVATWQSLASLTPNLESAHQLASRRSWNTTVDKHLAAYHSLKPGH